MKAIKKKSNILILLLILVNILPPSSLRLGIVTVIIVSSVMNAFRANNLYKCIYLRGLNSVVMLFTIYGLWLIIANPFILGMSGNRISNTSYLTTIYLSLLPIYSFYYYYRKGLLCVKDLRLWLPVLLIATTYQYYQTQAHLLEIITQRGYYSDVTNNTGYVFLALIPLGYIFKDKPLIRYGVMLYCMIFIMMSMKRGAIFIALGCIFLTIVENSKNGASLKSVFKNFFIVITIIGVVYYSFVNILSSNDYFSSKMASDGGSGRTDIYSVLWSTYLFDFNFLAQIFGKGANATILLIGNYAHNDWLEILINQGLVGIVVYMIYWKNFIREILKAKKIMHSYYPLLMLLMITLLKSFFSMSYSGMSYIECIAIGVYIAQFEQKRKFQVS